MALDRQSAAPYLNSGMIPLADRLSGNPLEVRPSKSRAEASGIIEVDSEQFFHFTDWCYDVPKWFPAIDKTRIMKLPDSAGMGKVTHYHGKLMGREMEWEAESAEWKENETWMMRAISGMPSRMGMALRLRFELAGPGKTKVTCILEYRAPYPLIGPLMDRFYLRHEAQRLVSEAIDSMKKVADQQMVPPLDLQFEKREKDHPGYAAPSKLHKLRQAI